MRLSNYARHLGISYHTAWRWFKAGQIKGFQAETGTIIVTESLPPVESGPVLLVEAKVAIYARVSEAENKAGKSAGWSRKPGQASMTAGRGC
jgi:putative resolvase